MAFWCFFAGIAGCLTANARAETLTGALYITTLPMGAEVWVDGIYVGRAPALVDGLARGRHTITLSKTGSVVQEADADVVVGNVTMTSVRLLPSLRTGGVRSTGSLLVREIPPNAQLSIDGLPYTGDASKAILLPAGLHQLSVGSARSKRTRAVTVLAETVTQVVMRDAPAENRAGVVAPAGDYLPPGSVALEGKKIVIRHDGHVVVAHVGEKAVRYDGSSVTFESSPQLIGRKLYLPLELLERLASEGRKPEPSR